MSRSTLYKVAIVGVIAPLVLTACGGSTKDSSGGSGGSSGSGSSKPIVIGSSLSLTGPLGQFGVDLQAGYAQQVSELNAAGGLQVGGSKRPVTLTVLDNRSDPNTASQQIRELVLKDSAVALLGACTPPINTPEALAAEQQKIPYVATCNPVLAFQAGNESGWTYAWDAFISEQDQAAGAAKGLAMANSNKKVALFTDTEPDGVAERPVYKQAFAAAGLDVVGDYTFPVGTTDFSSFINDAKTKGAQLVAAQMIPPDGIALWKQMKALSFQPVQAFATKAAATDGWPQALGPIAEGTIADVFWSPATGKANSVALAQSLDGKVPADLPDQSIAVLAYTISAVVTDAIKTAGSTDPSAVNTAIGKTNADYPSGNITFNSKHTATTPYLVTQWQGGKSVVILPTTAGVTFQDPAKAFQ